jgi:transposase InsO family protein
MRHWCEQEVSMSDEKRRKDIALFRYGLIAPVLHGAHAGCAADYFRQATASELEAPGLGLVRFKPDTLKSWLQAFRSGGLDALMPKPRTDLGSSRSVTPEIEKRLRELLTEHPRMSAALARERLVSEQVITSRSPSETALRRFIRTHGLRPPAPVPAERHAFAKRDPNELWTLDFMVGPRIEGMRMAPRLLAAIDDASRFVVLGRFLPSESYAELAPSLVEAFVRHGLPLALYCDNGAAFSTADLALACARLDVALIHSMPYEPEPRGKIERFFGTVRSRFLAGLDHAALASLAALDTAFTSWLESDYHRRVHSSLGVTPLARFLDSARPKRWVSRQELDVHFHHTVRRKVRSDCTVSVDGVRYETPPEWIGHTVELRCPLDEPTRLTLYAAGTPAAALKRVDPIDNDRINRLVAFAKRQEEA